MSNLTIQFLRGTAAQNDLITKGSGEITIDTTNNAFRLHDGVTPGGHLVRDVRTLTQTQIEGLISATLLNHSFSGDHDDRYYQQTEVDTLITEASFYAVGTTPPENPGEGQPWLDTNSLTVFVYTSGNWVQVVGEQGTPGRDGATKEEVLLAAGYIYDEVGDYWYFDAGTMD